MAYGTVRWGEKRRRVLMPLVGALLLLMGAAGVYASFDRNRWMRSYPYAAVVMFAKGGDRDAVLELHRRYKNVELSDSATRSLIEEALDVQRTDPAPANLADWLAMLDNFDTGRSFTAAQRERYLDQVFHNVKLEPRTVYREAERLMANLEVELRAIGMKSIAILHHHGAFGERIRIDYDKGNRFSAVQTIVGKGEVTLKFPALCDRSGGTDVTYELRLSVPDPSEEELGKGKTILLSFPTKILAFGEEYQFKSVHDRITGSHLLNAVAVKPSYSTMRSSEEGPVIAYQIRFDFSANEVLPASLVADVVLRTGDSEFQAGTLMAWKGTKVIDARMDVDKTASLSDGEVMVILKHNPSVTHQTAGLEEVYVADVTLGPIQIDRPWKREITGVNP